MIKQISIKNFAIIDDLTIDFQPGFNVFTGETGAGKSIIIEALGLLTGERANSSMVRHNTNKARIEGVFELSDDIITKFGLADYAEDNLIIISKEIEASGKSTCKINGHITTLSTIKQVSSNIIDIHSQQDNQYLMNKSYHLDLLDAFAAKNLEIERNNYNEAYNKYQELKQERVELETLTYNADLLELMKFQANEISEAKLVENEVEQLEVEQKRIQELSKLNDKIAEINAGLGGENGALIPLFNVKKVIENMQNDPLFAKYSEQIENLYYQLEDMYQSMQADFSNLNYDEFRINEIQERIFVINKLKRKYGDSTALILKKLEDLNNNISKMEKQATRLEELTDLIEKQREIVINCGQKLDKKRLIASKDLIQQISKHLVDLYLKDAQFGVILDPLPEPNAQGISSFEFSASLNPGTPLRPLVKIASGGEMSRLMLGLKIVFNTLYGISTSIFDEIDVGVSGKVARAVGLKMAELAKTTQVICITHSPQVASISKNHYIVEKAVIDNNTFTRVHLLNQDEQVIEIAKMLSPGTKVSDAAIANAKELLK